MPNQYDKTPEQLKIENEELSNRIKYLEDFFASYRIEMEDEFQRLQKESTSAKKKTCYASRKYEL